MFPTLWNTDTDDAEIDEIVQVDLDAILVIGFAESAAIVTVMNERGILPARQGGLRHRRQREPRHR